MITHNMFASYTVVQAGYSPDYHNLRGKFDPGSGKTGSVSKRIALVAGLEADI
jgi:hypothetical protein